ncbi:unnamed protein product [Bursaphelenchus okinawaensis]|uniref:Tyrosine phosphatase n=1 Tax=Bursaphelenchus okinawaensis TaxID=465554 RepID=A0A811LK22_9BILA|nr:unnamed protein product [Bursaphelenchus okinawaensis]CAG9123363.1 unnamed protein product [Bursaphelenchus okinawaensis]
MSETNTFDSHLSDANKQSPQKEIQAESVNEFIQKMTGGNRAQIVMEHDKIRKMERHVLSFTQNTDKNRFLNVLLYSEGSVKLTKPPNSNDTEYIHASLVKSRYGQYILGQAPKSNTLNEWYRMIWQYNVQVVVCLLPAINNEECCKYFEQKAGRKVNKGRFTLKTFAIRQELQCVIYEIRMKNSGAKKGEDKEHIFHIVHFPKWKIGDKSPQPKTLIQVFRSVWALEKSMRLGREHEGFVLVHGCSGVRRTGTFVVAAMLCRQIKETKLLAVPAIVAKVRRMRYGIMRDIINYELVIETALTYGCEQGLIDRKNIMYLQTIDKIRDSLKEKKTKERNRETEAQDNGGDTVASTATNVTAAGGEAAGGESQVGQSAAGQTATGGQSAAGPSAATAPA